MTLASHFGLHHGTLGIFVMRPSPLFFAYLMVVAIARVNPGHFPKFGLRVTPGILSNPSGAAAGSAFADVILALNLKCTAAIVQIFLQQISIFS